MKLSTNGSTGSAGARIIGVGDYRPARVVTNSDLEARVDTTDQWIRERTGIVTRRLAADHESVVDMGTIAAGKAIAAAGVDLDGIDLVLVATCSHVDRLPAAAPQIASRLGLTRPAALDVNAACAGFCYALAHAADAVRAGSARHAVVVGVEKLSDIVDWDDRTTCILFADGAGAVVVGPSPEPGIGPVVWGSDGSREELITCRLGDPFLRMDGPAVFRWATTQLAPLAVQACERAGLAPSDLRAVVLHQANNRIIDSIVRALRADQAVVARDVVDSGNTSAASIPMALARLVQLGEVTTGDPALLLGFGSGLTYAGQVVLAPVTPAADVAATHSLDPIRESTAGTRPALQEESSMSEQDVLAGLAEIVNEITGISPSDVQMDKSFADDLDVDSLSMVEIATAAEDKFDVKIPDDSLKNLKTVGDAVNYIVKAGAAA